MAGVDEILAIVEQLGCVSERLAGKVSAVRIESLVVAGDIEKAAAEAKKAVAGKVGTQAFPMFIH